MNQSKERKKLKELLLSGTTVNHYLQWVCSEFRYDGVNLWFRNRIPYTKEQLIKQYLNES